MATYMSIFLLGPTNHNLKEIAMSHLMGILLSNKNDCQRKTQTFSENEVFFYRDASIM